MWNESDWKKWILIFDHRNATKGFQFRWLNIKGIDAAVPYLDNAIFLPSKIKLLFFSWLIIREVFFKFKYFIMDVTISCCPCVTSIFYSSNGASSVWMRLKVGLITDSHRYIITVILAHFKVFSKKIKISGNNL